ncbi:MAG: ArsR/SmtB family transcription factor [Candidatus Methylacidiphilales bacterium]
MKVRSTRSIWKALNDPTRVRLLALLQESDLSVTEIRQITLLSQSLISAHLAVLRNEALVTTRKEGKSIYYEADLEVPAEVRVIVDAALKTLSEISESNRDQEELKNALRQRREATQQYFNRIAGKLGKAYCPGRTWSAVGPMLAHLIGDVEVADLGAGEGWLSLLLAQRARRVIAVDNAPKMVEFGQEQVRAHGIDNVEFRLGNLEDPPVEPSSMDVVVYSQALHHVDDPGAALLRGAVLLRPGGILAVLDLQQHRQDKAREMYHDRWLGFAESDLRSWFKAAGLQKVLLQKLEPDPHDPAYIPILASGRKR